MNAETLRQLFQSPFIYSEYSQKIVHDLFGCNYVYETLDSAERLNPSPDGDQNFFLGRMEDSERQLLGFFYTRVAEGSDVRRKRVGLWKLIQPYLKYEVEAAIAVFDDGLHWRLSYICDHKEGTTSAKRFSYVLGDKMGQYKTPLERLDKVAAKAGHFKLEDLKEAFSVDALSKEFFDEYHRHYDRILKTTVELISKDPTLYSGLSKLFADYIKKMMGRIVFLHFLQKKGWLNGDPDFLKNLFFMQPLDRREDFLEQVLEPLFFGIFNTEPQNREKLFRDEGWDVQLLDQWKGLPYLNGGLFERDSMDTAKLKLPASLFERLFEFMASYNFTVDENDPDDADIGVDPEMLGKIFESLLEDNKAKGAFYTPKEIVRYMCKESLIAYLGTQATGQSKASGIQATGLSKESGTQATGLSKESGTLATGLSKEPGEQASSLSKESGIKATGLPKEPGEQASSLSEESGVKSAGLSDYIRKFVEQHEFPEELEPYREVLDNALRNVKICDPAIGSGAFPMGLLNELWRCREALEERATSPSLMGTQANGLSQAGSLYSKEGQAGSLNPYSRAALKREIIENNIYGVDIEKGAIDIARLRFWLSIVVDAEWNVNPDSGPEPLPNFDYKFMQGNSLIESFDGHDLSHIMDKDRGSRSIPGRSARRAGWAENQTGMEFGSDEVKQNLRNWLKMYFSLTDHKEKAYYRKLINSSVKNYIVQQGIGPVAETRLNAIDPSANKDFFLWHTWFKDIFDKGGFDIVIANPPYIDSETMVATMPDVRQYYSEKYKTAKGNWDIFVVFIEHGLNISAKGGVFSFIVPNKLIAAKYATQIREEIENNCIIAIRDYSRVDVFANASVYPCTIVGTKTKQDNNLIFAEMSSKDCINRCNVIPQATFNSCKYWDVFFNESHTVDIIRKYLSGKAISKFRNISVTAASTVSEAYQLKEIMFDADCLKPNCLQIVNTGTIDPYSNLWGVFPMQYIKNKYLYPQVAAADLKQMNGNRLIQAKHSKIIVAGMSKRIEAILDSGNTLAGKSTTILLCDDVTLLKYILGIINSKLSTFCVSIIYNSLKMAGGFMNVATREVQSMTIPDVVDEAKYSVVELVDKILTSKRTNPVADTSDLEREIDQQVYALYNLTPEEIAIIEQ